MCTPACVPGRATSRQTCGRPTRLRPPEGAARTTGRRSCLPTVRARCRADVLPATVPRPDSTRTGSPTARGSPPPLPLPGCTRGHGHRLLVPPRDRTGPRLRTSAGRPGSSPASRVHVASQRARSLEHSRTQETCVRGMGAVNPLVVETFSPANSGRVHILTRACRAELAWMLAMPGNPALSASNRSRHSAARTSPTMMRDGRIRSDSLTRWRSTISPVPSRPACRSAALPSRGARTAAQRHPQHRQGRELIMTIPPTQTTACPSWRCTLSARGARVSSVLETWRVL